MLAGVADAIATGQTDARDILAAVTPGGGKSLLPVLAAARLMAAGVVDRVCWVVPRDTLRLQAEEAFADPAWRAVLGHVFYSGCTCIPVPGITRHQAHRTEPA